MERNTHRQNQNTQNVGCVGFANAYWRSSCRIPPTPPPGGRLPTLRSPIRFGVQFKLVWFYYAQRRAGRPRSSPRRFAAIVCLSADGMCFGFGGAFWCTFWLLPFQGGSYWGRFFTWRCPVLWAFCPVGA
ncbi:MAG: hypothetical protein LBQ66_05825 [Planctomycetaceae bacterium]|nr:hypothetical protein [Planctomycetaceae bacterium]